MVCLPTITAPTGSWARCSETSRADVRQTHRATVRSDERARPPRRAPGRSSTYPPQAPGRRVRAKPGHTRLHEIRFENPATPAKGTTCFRSFSIGNDLFTTVFTAQMGRGKIQWGAFTSVCVECLFLRSPSRVPYRTELLPRAPKGRRTQSQVVYLLPGSMVSCVSRQ